MSGLFDVTARAIGINIPKVPHDVPDANPSAQDTTKNSAGMITTNPPGTLSIIFATNLASPSESVIPLSVQAIESTRIGDTMDLKPSGMHSMSSANGTTLLIK